MPLLLSVKFYIFAGKGLLYLKHSAMKKTLLLPLVAAFLFGACSNSAETKEVKKEVKIEKKIVSDENLPADAEDKALATIGVSGMSCGMACVSKIETALNKLEGVNNAKVSFEQDRDVDFAEVDFDHEKISEKEIISTIQGLSEGQYQVSTVEVEITTAKKSDEATEDAEATEGEGETAYNYGLGLKLPNLFNVVKTIVQ